MNLFRRLLGSDSEEEAEVKEVEKAEIDTDEVYQPLEKDVIDEALAETEQESPEEPEPPMATRPLPPPKAFESTNRRIQYGETSDVGQIRANNQDACLSLLATPEISGAGNPPPIGFFVVADGMGGHTDGELASAVTVQTLTESVIHEIVIPHIDGRDRTADQKTIPEVLATAMDVANIRTQEKVPSGGTTATCAVIRGDLAYIAHVGDSRAYLISEGNMELITRDHSLVRRLQELGQLTPDEAEVHPQRNVLYRAIGQGEEMEVDAATRRMPPSSRLLLCSDGLWGLVDDEKMADVLADHTDPQEACDELVRLANQAGGPDNITVVLVQMPS